MATTEIDLSRRYFISVAARRYTGLGYQFKHSVGAADDCDTEADAHAWAADWAEMQWPGSQGWKHDIIIMKADHDD